MDTHRVTEFCLVDTSGWPGQVGIEGVGHSGPQPMSKAFLERAMVQTVTAAADCVERRPDGHSALHTDRRPAGQPTRAPARASTRQQLGVLVLLALVAHSFVEWWSPQFFRLPQRLESGDTKLWM